MERFIFGVDVGINDPTKIIVIDDELNIRGFQTIESWDEVYYMIWYYANDDTPFDKIVYYDYFFDKEDIFGQELNKYGVTKALRKKVDRFWLENMHRRIQWGHVIFPENFSALYYNALCLALMAYEHYIDQMRINPYYLRPLETLAENVENEN